MMFKAFNEIVKKYHLKKKIKLVLIGEYEKNAEGIEYENIHFLGHVNYINELLYISDCTILPSIREGLPRSILESLSANKPVIAANIRGVRDISAGECLRVR